MLEFNQLERFYETYRSEASAGNILVSLCLRGQTQDKRRREYVNDAHRENAIERNRDCSDLVVDGSRSIVGHLYTVDQ
jgi:hypothetical protein